MMHSVDSVDTALQNSKSLVDLSLHFQPCTEQQYYSIHPLNSFIKSPIKHVTVAMMNLF